MNKLQTEYSIGEAVFLPSTTSVKKRIIDAIKIEGVEQKISYGFEDGSSHILLFSYDKYVWYPESDLFASLSAATSRQKQLAKKAEEKKIVDRENEIRRREEQLEKDTKALKLLKRGMPLPEDDCDE